MEYNKRIIKDRIEGQTNKFVHNLSFNPRISSNFWVKLDEYADQVLKRIDDKGLSIDNKFIVNHFIFGKELFIESVTLDAEEI